MPILNSFYGVGGSGGGNIGEPLNLTVTTSGLDATITWEDNEIGTIPPTTFQKSELVRKIGSAPTSPSDGVLVVTETVKDTYKVSGYVDQGLTDGETYYYRVFSYSDLGGISYCDAVSVTPSGGGWQPGVNTLIYLPLNGDTDNQGTYSSGDGTLPGSIYYSWEYINGVSGTQYWKSTAPYGQNWGVTIHGNYNSSALGGGDRTVSIWLKFVTGYNNNKEVCPVILGASGGGDGSWFGLWCKFSGSTHLGILRYMDDPYTGNFTYQTGWHNYVMTYNDANKAKIYVDGQQVILESYTSASFNTTGTDYYIGTLRAQANYELGYSNFIIESAEWTSSDVLDYYNATKGDYGIS